MNLMPWRKSLSIPSHRHSRGSPFVTLQDEINNVFDDFFNMDFPSATKSGMSGYALPIDIIDEDDSYKIVAELPGMNADDIDVSVDNGRLTIKGERKDESEEKKKDYVLRESWSGSFYRSIVLPDNVDKDKKFTADFKKGALTITLPKQENSVKEEEKKIKINSE